MPTDSLGVDMDPKTYSPMSGSDENMSSPPSVLTTASAGSCTPSSLPSAGSTPSSIPSAGSTPYQFVTQEESTIIKPLTPSDHQSVHPFTPENLPITPEPSVSVDQLIPTDIHPGKISNLASCKSNLLSGIDGTRCIVNPNNELSGIADELNERREDCSCIMCDDKHNTIVDPLQCEKNKVGEMREVILKSGETHKSRTKDKLPKVKDPVTVKDRRKKHISNKKNKTIYHSEISGDPESTSIKLKIKLTTPFKKKNVLDSALITPACAVTLNPLSSSLINQDTLPNMIPSNPYVKLNKCSSKKRQGLKRKSSESSLSKVSPSSEGRKRRKSKPLEQFSDWGPVLSEVNGEQQSDWGYRIPTFVLHKIFLYVTYDHGSIPFLLRMARVCRLWREVTVYPSLWHTTNLPSWLIKARYRNEKKLLWIVENRLQLVEDLNLSGWTEAVSPLMLRRISEFCPQLRGLNVSSCFKLHAENLNALLSSSNKLERLELTNIMGAHKPTPRCAVGQQTLSELASNMKSRFTHLIIANNTLSNVPSIINSLAEHCDRLQVLDLSSVETIGRDSVRLDIEKLQRGCPLLRILRLANSLFRLCQTSMTVQASSPGFPALEELSVAVDDRANIGMNDSELERILKNSNKLRLLDVRGCHNITDSSLVRIPPWDIEHLFLAGGSTPRSYSDRLELVIRKWQHSLVELDLSWTGSSEAIDVALFALAEEKNDKLRVLNLCGSSMNFGPVKKLLEKCSSLERLNLTSCRALPRGVKRLYDNEKDIAKLKSRIDEGKFDDQPDADRY